jgi:predicted small lipoprotein YifL
MKQIPLLAFVLIMAATVTQCGQKGGLTRPQQNDISAFVKYSPV